MPCGVDGSSAVFVYAEFLFAMIFTCESVLRVATFTPFHRVWRTPLLWLDVLTVLPFWLRLCLAPGSLTPATYLSRATGGDDDAYWSPARLLRVFGSLASWRLLKLARYYEGAGLLVLALGKSLSQLLVPLFMLFVMLVCFSALLVELEWDAGIEACRARWVAAGVSPASIASARQST